MDNAHLFKHRQGHKNKVAVVAGHTCKVEVEQGVQCGKAATLSRTKDGVVKRTCSIHWRTPKQRANAATERLLQELGLTV